MSLKGKQTNFVLSVLAYTLVQILTDQQIEEKKKEVRKKDSDSPKQIC